MPNLFTSESSGSPPVDLAMEANHRVANHLSALVAIIQRKITAITSGPASIPRDEMLDALKDMGSKILAVSCLHRSLATPSNHGDVDLEPVLTSILRDFERSGIFGDRLRVSAHLAADCRVDDSRALMLTLALSEIVTNAIKYAHPTGLPVEIALAGVPTADGGVLLTVADDGVGFPEGFEEGRDAGVGLRLVRSLVENSGGELAIASDELGLCFSIRLPPK